MTEELAGRCGSCGYYNILKEREGGGTDGECFLGCWPAPLRENRTCTRYKAKGTDWQNEYKKNFVPLKPTRTRSGEVPYSEPKLPLPKELDLDMHIDEFKRVLTEVLRQEIGVGEVEMLDRFRGGEVVVKPGKEGTAERTIPIDGLFHKVVMVRDKLRVLEQKINGSKNLEDDEKVQLQQYITACYGSLTTFNFLFRDKEDYFVGAKSE